MYTCEMIYTKSFAYFVVLLVLSFDFHTNAKSSEEHGSLKNASCQESQCVTSLRFGSGQASRQVVRSWSMTDETQQRVRGKRQSAFTVFPIQPLLQETTIPYEYLPPSYLPVFPTTDVVQVIPNVLPTFTNDGIHQYSTLPSVENLEKGLQSPNSHILKSFPSSNCNGQFVPILRDPHEEFYNDHKPDSSLQNNANPSAFSQGLHSHFTSLPRYNTGDYRQESQSQTVGDNKNYRTNSRALFSPSKTKFNKPPLESRIIPSASNNFHGVVQSNDNSYSYGSHPQGFRSTSLVHVGPQSHVSLNGQHGVQISSTYQANNHYNSKPTICSHNMGNHCGNMYPVGINIPQPPAPPLRNPKQPALDGTQTLSHFIKDYHDTRSSPVQNHDAGYFYGPSSPGPSVDITDHQGPQPPAPPPGGPMPPAPPTVLYGPNQSEDYHRQTYQLKTNKNDLSGSNFLSSTYTTKLEGPLRPPDSLSPASSAREMNYPYNSDKGYYYGPYPPSPIVDFTTERPIPQPPAPPPGGPMPPAPPRSNAYGTQFSSSQYANSADKNSLNYNLPHRSTSTKSVYYPIEAPYPPPGRKEFQDPTNHIIPRPPSPPPTIGYSYPHPESSDLKNPRELHFISPVNYKTHHTDPYDSIDLHPESHIFEDVISNTQVSIVPSISYSFADLAQEGTNSSPIFAPRNNSFLHKIKSVASDEGSSAEIEVTDIKCMNSASGRFFKAILRSLGGNTPVLDNSISCPLIHQEETTRYHLDIAGRDFEQCGIRECFNEENTIRPLCASIRIPKLSGLRTPEDTIFTIECYPTSPVNVLTKTLAFRSPSYVQPRGIISGGSEAHIASEMALYVQPPGSIYFSRRISLDDLVRLGDEIQLRCDVRDGDGWQYSRLKDITLHRRSTDGIEIEDSVVLVGPDGCRNPAMKTVCPWQPVQHSDRPLTSSFTWKAFGFQDKGNEKEDLVVSARVLACVHPSDCLLDTSSCTDETQSTRPRRRDVKDAKTNNETVIWRSDLTFKVTKSSASS